MIYLVSIQQQTSAFIKLFGLNLRILEKFLIAIIGELALVLHGFDKWIIYL